MAQMVQNEPTVVCVVSDRSDVGIIDSIKDKGHVTADSVIEIKQVETSSIGIQVSGRKVDHNESTAGSGEPEIVITVYQSRDGFSLSHVDQGTSGCSVAAAEDCESHDPPKRDSTLDLNVHDPVNANALSTVTTKRSEISKGVIEDFDGEMVCRICHLSSEQSFDSNGKENSDNAAASELIRLGCGCKDELGIAHSVCAEAWFKIKGNRLCEICGETARNISGVWDDRFIDKWHDRLSTSSNISIPVERTGCWRRQPFCNFLMACLVIAFVFPWFFRVKIF